MPCRVVVTDDAYGDLDALYAYVAAHDSVIQAERIMQRLLDAADSLAQDAERGSHPRELLTFGQRNYRQLVLKPWRLIYGVKRDRVVVYLIADGRRDMRSLLAQRLLEA